MSGKDYVHPSPGKSYEQWKKDNPYKGPNKTTTTTRVIKKGEKIPFGPGPVG